MATGKIRAQIVATVNAHMEDSISPGIDLPMVRTGSVGNDARALGGASLPLSDKFLINLYAFFNR